MPLERFGDNNAAYTIAIDNVKSNRTKHILVMYAFAKDIWITV